MQTFFRGSRALDGLLARRTWRVEPRFLGDLRGVEGVIPFKTRDALTGNFLVDRSLTFPIQVINYTTKRPVVIDRAYFEKCLDLAYRHRQKLASQNQLDISDRCAFRLINEIGDGIPGLSVDVLGEYGFIHLYTRHWKDHVKWLAQAIMTRPERRLAGVYVADHVRDPLKAEEERLRNKEKNLSGKKQKESSNFKSICVSGRKAEEHKSSVIENGIKFNIRLDMGSSTGLYLDQRRNRQRLAALFDRIPEHPSGHPKTMLNTFSYTCSFSLFAALKGVRTVNVDASPIAIAIARQNFRDNALDPEQHVFYIKDVFMAMVGMDNDRQVYDLVLLDPPTVSRIRRPDGRKFTFSTSENYDELVSIAAPLVAPGGFLVACINTHTIDKEKWHAMIETGLNDCAQRKKAQFDYDRYASKRAELRKKTNMKKKERNRKLEDLQKEGKFETTEEDVKQFYAFKKVDEWGQDVDFGVREGDTRGSYLHCIVLQRVGGTDSSSLSQYVNSQLNTNIKLMSRSTNPNIKANTNANGDADADAAPTKKSRRSKKRSGSTSSSSPPSSSSFSSSNRSTTRTNGPRGPSASASASAGSKKKVPASEIPTDTPSTAQ